MKSIIILAAFFLIFANTVQANTYGKVIIKNDKPNYIMTINGQDFKYNQEYILEDEIFLNGSWDVEVVVELRYVKNGEKKRIPSLQLPFSLNESTPVQIYKLSTGFEQITETK